MMAGNTAYKWAVSVALVAALFPFYIELAVGIVDPPGGPLLWLQLGVVAVGLTAAILARFRPLGMIRALVAAALAQALVAVIAVIALPSHPASPPLEVLGVNAIFVALILGSAWLFRRAAMDTRFGVS